MQEHLITRRELLQTVGGVIAITGVSSPAIAKADTPVFVHPQNEETSQAVDAVREHGGKALMTYDNFAFIAARIPADNRKELEKDDRVAFVEDDDKISTIEPVDKPDNPGNGNGNGGGGGGDGNCNDHPSQESSWGFDRISAGEAHDSATGAGIDVAILDTGIQKDHCDLKGNLAGGYNATGKGPAKKWGDKNGHGTHCAGIVGATDDSIGVVGVAPDVNLYGVKVLDNNGSGRWSWFVNGVDWCLNNDIPVMSASLGASSANSTVQGVVEEAYDKGHMLVAAAGNEGSSPDDDIEGNVHYPGAYDYAIAVGAMEDTSDGEYSGASPLATYSSTGAQVEFMAPGSNIRSTYIDDTYETLSGTSMACPHATGVTALVAEIYGLTLEDSTDGSAEDNGPVDPSSNKGVRDILRDTANPRLVTADDGEDYPTTIDDLSKHNDSDGYGLILAKKAVKEAQSRV